MDDKMRDFHVDMKQRKERLVPENMSEHKVKSYIYSKKKKQHFVLGGVRLILYTEMGLTSRKR